MIAIHGTLDAGAVASAAASGKWTPPADWPDIRRILADDVAPAGYQKLGAVLIADNRRTYSLNVLGGSYYRTWDGYTGTSAAYPVNSATMTPTSEGYNVGWIIIYGTTGNRNITLFSWCADMGKSILWGYIDDANITDIQLGMGTGGNAGCFILRAFETTEKTTTSITAFRVGLCNGCRSMEKFTFPDGPTTIQGTTLSGCLNLRDLSLPKTLTTVTGGGSDFANLWSLAELDVSMFQGFTGNFIQGLRDVSKLKLPASFISIEANALSSLKNLRELTITGDSVAIGQNVLAGGVINKLTLDVNGVVNATTGALGSMQTLTRLELRQGCRFTGNFTLQTDYSLKPDDFVEYFAKRIADNTGNAAITITVWNVLWSQLTTDEQAILTNKNYIVQTALG